MFFCLYVPFPVSYNLQDTLKAGKPFGYTSSYPQVGRLRSSPTNCWCCRNRWKILETLLVAESEQQDIQYKNNHHDFLVNFFLTWTYPPLQVGFQPQPHMELSDLMAAHSRPHHWRFSFSIMLQSRRQDLSKSCHEYHIARLCNPHNKPYLYLERSVYFAKLQIYLEGKESLSLSKKFQKSWWAIFLLQVGYGSGIGQILGEWIGYEYSWYNSQYRESLMSNMRSRQST